MTAYLALLIFVLLAQPRCNAKIIPANRRMVWIRGTNVGVPGGIPKRTKIFVNVKTTENANYRCAGDGMTDDTPHLTAAMKACPPEQVVYVPAGTYRLDDRVLVQTTDNCTLRGDGPGRTIFLCTSGRGRFWFGTHQWPIPVDGALPVTGGATVGSTVLTVADAGPVHGGNLISLRMDS